ncbi:hypothetical protein [Nodularia sp. NIES-3585]|uniref:hypothetical protein n=1 Tax=Nodularia sp. NIES-3585 TaxID=1973477 RepID=UPI000B5CCCB5|nr:hypothetical protein [Nodularia sp. NIES-3585]GAX38496.1 hypothetical protein NIES3585_45450 [Nodularia sp. NIES-3585]
MKAGWIFKLAFISNQAYMYIYQDLRKIMKKNRKGHEEHKEKKVSESSCVSPIYFAIKLILLSSFFRHEYEALIYIPQKDAFRDITSMNTLMPTH